MSLFRFKPIYQKRPWGGHLLETHFKRQLPEAGVPYGESWELSGQPSPNHSIIKEGHYQGQSLRDLLNNEGENLLGGSWQKGTAFPLLIKWLDCQERLSLQVHPNQTAHNAKTECWYVVKAKKGAGVFLGIKPEVSQARFETQLKEPQHLDNLLNYFPAKPGDLFFVPSGTIHAIDAGLLLLEIQQNSDTTYRVYDWNRKGLDGHPRELHTKEALEHMDLTMNQNVKGPIRLDEMECPYFKLREYFSKINEPFKPQSPTKGSYSYTSRRHCKSSRK